jgi:hypothetical protein
MPLLIGVAMAQDAQPATPGQQDKTQQAAPAQQTATPPAQTSPTPTPTTSNAPAELKTQTFKGALVDASCASGSGTSAATPTPTGNAGTNDAAKNSSSSAERTDTSKDNQQQSAAGAGCQVTSSTTRFALKTTDGRTLPFDLVGNERAQQAVKEKKKWSEAMASGKPISVKVSGVISGQKLTVMSIN